MPFKFSRCLCLQVLDLDRALAFYHDVMGLEVINQDPDGFELKAEPVRLFAGPGSAPWTHHGISGPRCGEGEG